MKLNLILTVLILGSMAFSLAYNNEESYEDLELIKLKGILNKVKEVAINKLKSQSPIPFEEEEDQEFLKIKLGGILNKVKKLQSKNYQVLLQHHKKKKIQSSLNLMVS